jgi:hypothetical protein
MSDIDKISPAISMAQFYIEKQRREWRNWKEESPSVVHSEHCCPKNKLNAKYLSTIYTLKWQGRGRPNSQYSITYYSNAADLVQGRLLQCGG